MRRRVLIVGSGDVARRAIPWLVRRFQVFALTRNGDERTALRALGAVPLMGDLDAPETLRRLAGIADYIIHAAPPPVSGRLDPRTRRLAAVLGRGASLARALVYISTSGVYGDCHGAWVSETRPVRPSSERALRRCDAEECLRSFGRRGGTRVSILRAPGIYAAERLPLDRLRRRIPILRAEDDVHTNHIHADDLAGALCAALMRGRAGRRYNANDDTDMTVGSYFELAADTFGLPRPPRVSRAEMAAAVSAMALSFMSESRRLDNTRLKRELRYRLRFPTVRDGLAAAARAQA
jgi:nucleoside-diphosphate-sugar epimerase